MELTWKLLCWLAFTVLEHAMLAELIFIRNYCHAFFVSHDTVFLALITVIVFCTIFNAGGLFIWDVYKAPILLPVTCQATQLCFRFHLIAPSLQPMRMSDLFKREVGLCMGTWRRRDLTFCFFLYGNLICKGYLIFNICICFQPGIWILSLPHTLLLLNNQSDW